MRPLILDQLSFKKYGTPVKSDEKQAFAEGAVVKKQRRSYSEMWMYDSGACLEPVDGVGIVYVCTNPAGNMEVFLLDKPVKINPGVYFCIVPYGCDYTFIIYADCDRETAETGRQMTSDGILPKIRVSALYTTLYQEKERGFIFKGEKHPFWELTYVDKGSVICGLNGMETELSQGDMIFFQGGQFHSQRSDGNTSACFFTVTFDLEFKGDNILSGKVIKADAEIYELMKYMVREYRSIDIYSEDMIVCLLTQVIIRSMRNISTHMADSSIPLPHTLRFKSRLVLDACRIIDENIGKPISVGSLAAQLCISPSLLSKAFRAETSDSVSAYIRERRMEMAKDFLRLGSYSISQISELLGFCSVCYFSSEFKKHFSVTPGEYSRAVNQD